MAEWLRVPDLMLNQRHSDNGQVRRGPSLTNKIIFYYLFIIYFALVCKSRKGIMKMKLKRMSTLPPQNFTGRKPPKSYMTTSMVSHLESRLNKEHGECEEKKV